MTRPRALIPFAGRRGWWVVALLAVVAAARALAHLVPLLLRDDLFVGDTAPDTFWLYRMRDPSLFPHDPAAYYFSQWFLTPPAYQWVVGSVMRVFDPQHVVEVLAILLSLTALALTALLGHRVGRRTGAGAALVVLWAVHGESLTEGGFPRSFAVVLLLGGMYALLRRRWALLGLAVLALATTYPPVVLDLGAATTVIVLRNALRRRRPPRSFYVFLGLTALAAAALAANYLRPLPPELGKPFPVDQMRHMSEWRHTGRVKFFGPSPTHFYFEAPMAGVGLSLPQAIVAAVVLLATPLLGRSVVPLEAWALLAGTLALWALAHLLMFHLYFPGRYTMYALPVFAIMWASAVAGRIGRMLPAFPTRRLVAGGAVAFAVFALTVDVRGAFAEYHSPGNWATTAGYDAALAFLRTLSKKTLIAAHPDDANPVPLRCRRGVLVTTETALPFHDRYYREMKRRTEDSFALLYATDWADVERVAAHDRVDVFLLDRTRLTDPAARPYLQPFQLANEPRIAAGRAKGFALLNPPADRVLFAQGDMMVIRLRPTNASTIPSQRSSP